MTAGETVGALLAALEGLEDGWAARGGPYHTAEWWYCTVCDVPSERNGRIPHAPGCAVTEAREAMAAARAWLEPDEPTVAQLEALNNPDNAPPDASYRAAMRDAGRGGLLR